MTVERNYDCRGCLLKARKLIIFDSKSIRFVDMDKLFKHIDLVGFFSLIIDNIYTHICMYTISKVEYWNKNDILELEGCTKKEDDTLQG